MSKESFETFVEYVSSDKTVAAQLEAAIEGKEGDDAVQCIVAFANEAGFKIDAEHVARLGSAPDGELTDDLMGAIAGGANIWSPSKLR